MAEGRAGRKDEAEGENKSFYSPNVPVVNKCCRHQISYRISIDVARPIGNVDPVYEGKQRGEGEGGRGLGGEVKIER